MVALFLVSAGQEENANAKIESIEQNIHSDANPNQSRPKPEEANKRWIAYLPPRFDPRRLGTAACSGGG